MYVGSVPGLPFGVMDDVVAPPLINGDDMPRRWWYPYGVRDKRNHTKPQLRAPTARLQWPTAVWAAMLPIHSQCKAKVTYN